MKINAEQVRMYAEAYGVAVRAGVLTPNRDDEAHIRKMFGLPMMNAEVQASWDDSDGVRAPITLAKELQEVQQQPEQGGSVEVPEQNAFQPIAFASVKKNSIDEKNPRLEQSDFDRFDYAFAKTLKEDFDDIWQAGGNIRGEEAFEYWTKYRSGERTEGVLDWVKEREAWSARHFNDGKQFQGADAPEPNLSNIAGIVAQIKWGTVGVLGERRMKAIINEVKSKLRD